jgi:hypothetical protein
LSTAIVFLGLATTQSRAILAYIFGVPTGITPNGRNSFVQFSKYLSVSICTKIPPFPGAEAILVNLFHAISARAQVVASARAGAIHTVMVIRICAMLFSTAARAISLFRVHCFVVRAHYRRTLTGDGIHARLFVAFANAIITKKG